MLEELGVPYDLKLVDIGKGDQFKPEFPEDRPRTIACRRSSILRDRAARRSRCSSRAPFLQYLGRKFGRFYPTDERQRVAVRGVADVADGRLWPMLGPESSLRVYAPEKIPYAIKRYRDETHRLYGGAEPPPGRGGEFVADAYSIADMANHRLVARPRRQGMTSPSSRT